MSQAIETCPCGARIEITTDESRMKYRLAEWRKDHHHEIAEGQRESSVDALVEQSGPTQVPEMQIGFSRATEDWESRR